MGLYGGAPSGNKRTTNQNAPFQISTNQNELQICPFWRIQMPPHTTNIANFRPPRCHLLTDIPVIYLPLPLLLFVIDSFSFPDCSRDVFLNSSFFFFSSSNAFSSIPQYCRLSISSFSCRLAFGCGCTISGQNVRRSSARCSVCS